MKIVKRKSCDTIMNSRQVRPSNLNNNNNSFKSRPDISNLNMGKVANFPLIKKISDNQLDNIYDRLSSKLTPDFVSKNGGEVLFKKQNNLVETLQYPIFGLPFDILNSIANKFNLESLKKWTPLQNYNSKNQTKAYERAMRGLLQNGDNFIEKSKTKSEDEIAKKFYKLFDDNFRKDKAKYHTPHERTVVKFVTGTTAALMLGNDFYNKSILNGKDNETATKESKEKRKQEMLETIQETVSQYFMLGAFSNFTNNSKLGAPILSTLMGVIFKITSRLSMGRSLTRIKPKNEIVYKTPSIEEFKNEKTKTLVIDKIQEPKEDKNKKHVLTLKNIGLACLASIGLGFLGKGVKSTKVFNAAKDSLMNTKLITLLKDKIHNFTVGEVWVNEKELSEFASILKNKSKSSALFRFIKYDVANAFSNPDLVKDGKIFLGEYEKMSKIPIINWEFSRKELLQIPLAIPKLAIELFSYPYKAAHKILEGFGVVKKVEKPKLRNDYNILHTYLDYKEQLEKHNPQTQEQWKQFREFYKQRIDDNIISALNNETKSKVDNAAIGKTTQLLGTFGSLYFAMTDDYNRTIKQTNDPEKAGKDARLRGVNKMVRISTQSVCMGINQLFKIPYARSIVGAGLISIVCTIMTDTISRFLSGMPSRRMNKEELEQYNQHKKQGALRFYYDTLDKLTD